MSALLLVVLAVGVAYGNGANDISKGIATLVGSGVTDLRRALFWGTAWTVAGGGHAVPQKSARRSRQRGERHLDRHRPARRVRGDGPAARALLGHRVDGRGRGPRGAPKERAPVSATGRATSRQASPRSSGPG